MFEQPSRESSETSEFRVTRPRDPLIDAAQALVRGAGRLLRRAPIRLVRVYRQLAFARAPGKKRDFGPS